MRPRPPAQQHASIQLTFPEVGSGLPSSGLLYSAIVHELIFFVLLFLSFTYIGTGHSESLHVARMINLNDPSQLVYLPSLGGGQQGNGRPAGGSAEARKASPPPAPSHGSKGFNFPGPQPIVSDPPQATNAPQTVIHPAPEKRPPLRQFVPLPNIVHMANSMPLPADVVAAKPALPNLHPVPAPPDPPRLALPLPTVHAENVPLAELREAPQPVEPVQKPIDPPKPEQASVVPTRGTDLQTVVSLSPIPAPADPSTKLPLGESRGSFAVSPISNIKSLAPEPGSKTEAGAPVVGIGAQTTARASNAAVGPVAGAGTNLVAGIMGGGAGMGSNLISGTGTGKGGASMGLTVGTGGGPGFGTGAGITTGSGTGAGSGPGHGEIAGITIQGGKWATGTAGKAPNAGGGVTVPPQTAYAMTIVSTPESGGGFSDSGLGVFAQEKVYTVFLDMRATTEDPTPAWTLQYAPLRGAASEANASREGIMPPFPVAKQRPRFPVALARRYAERIVVVSAILNSDGKLEQISIKQSPDARLSVPLLEALTKWMFRPAQLNGQPVPIKVLLGIPLSAR